MLLDDDIKKILAEARVIAVVGAVDKPTRPVDGVGRYLMQHGFTVLPVHPNRKDVWGLKTYASLGDIDRPVDIVNLFRASQHCPEHARETLAMTPPPKLFWMQSGVRSEEATQILAGSSVAVTQDQCIKVVHQQLQLESRP